MKKGKGMKFVGDSRVRADSEPFAPKDYSEYPGRTEAFWPDFLLKEWLVGAVFIVGFLCLTIAHPSPLEGMADPTSTEYIPLPDWYFLFLYQLLKYDFASGNYMIFGIIILPGLAFGALFLAPFLDSGPGRRPQHRPIAVSMMVLAFAATAWLTYESVANVDWEERAEANKPIPPSGIELDESAAGYEIYQQSCASCHGDDLSGGSGPALFGMDRSVEEIAEIAVDGVGSMPAGIFTGSDEELEDLAEFIDTVNKENE